MAFKYFILAPPKHHLKRLSIVTSSLAPPISRKTLKSLRAPRMRIRPHNAPVHKQSLHLSIHTFLTNLSCIRILRRSP